MSPRREAAFCVHRPRVEHACPNSVRSSSYQDGRRRLMSSAFCSSLGRPPSHCLSVKLGTIPTFANGRVHRRKLDVKTELLPRRVLAKDVLQVLDNAVRRPVGDPVLAPQHQPEHLL